MASKLSPEQALSGFWNRVDKSGGEPCWLWTGANSGGYGYVRWHGKTCTAHRVSYELAHGSIPDGLNVLHDCPDGDNPRCVNPAHLWLGTTLDNVADMKRKGRASHGERHYNSKLTDAQVDEIRRSYAAGGVTQRELAAKYGVHPTNIGHIVRRKNRNE